MKRLTLLLTCFVLSMGLAIAQTVQVKGLVVDESNEPIPGASVRVKENTAIGTVTNANGQFTLEVPASATTLILKYLGMEDLEVAVAPEINVQMKIAANLMDEVVVVAYGTAKKETFTGSVGVVSSAKLEKRTVSNVTKALEGTIPGIQVTTGSGQPGTGATIMVRGYGSIGSSNEPLYVVDGAAYEGSIAAINPADIEAISFLKDASAGALYGARGANGVVMITTKKGSDKQGKVKVEFKGLWGYASRAIPQYDLMDEKDFLETSFIISRNEQIYKNGIAPELAGQAAVNAMINGGSKLFGTNQEYNPYNMPFEQVIDPVTGKINPAAQLRYDHDWMDAITAENPLRQEYTLSFSGGNNATKYFASVNYLNEEGLLKTTSFERIAGRLNVDSDVQKWLKIGGNANFAFNTTNSQGSTGSATSNPWYSVQNMAPIYPIYELDANSQIQYDGEGKPMYDYGVRRPAGASPNFNTIALLFDDAYGSRSDNVGLRGFGLVDLSDSKYDFTKGITFKIDVSTTLQNATSMTYYNPLYGNAGGETAGRLTKGATRMFSYTFNQILGYNRSFGEHNIDVILGHENFSRQYNNLSASKTGFPFPNIYELNPGSVLASISSYEDNYRIESYFSRARYSYADKYNFDASFRTDGSSRFYKDSRWGKFWSVGANWRVSEEEFLKSTEWLNNLSIRASYGEQGNDNVNTYYAWQSFYTLGYHNAKGNSSYVSSLESRDLKWEKNGNLNIGLEARLFDSRLSIVAEYFNRVTSDLLLDVPMATSLGFNSYRKNIGSMYNRGFEFSLGYKVIKSENFDWNFTILGTTIKNEITKLVTDKPIIGTQLIKVGEPLYAWYLPRGAGVDPATGKKLYWVWDERDPITDEPISEPYISSDYSKAANSRVAWGNKTPDFFGSVGSEFKIFNVDFSFLTVYSIGGTTYDSQYYAYMEPLYPGANLHNNLKRAWQQPGDITDVPRIEMNSGNRVTGDDLIDASFFAIRNISIGYNLPRKITKKMNIENLRIFASGDNLKTFSHLDGMDPQSGISSNTTYSYTPVRTISLGVNINF